jgi:guanylate kinase
MQAAPSVDFVSARSSHHGAVMLVVSAPSGAGKTTLCRRLLEENANLRYSISCTTRAPREGEVNGRDYHFLSVEEFKARLARGEFLEHAQVYQNFYGTLRSAVEDLLRAGTDVLMDVDVQGADQLRRRAGELADSPVGRGYADVFIAPPSLAELRRRLESRAKDAPDVIERRMRAAEAEMASAGQYDYVVVNDQLESAYRSLAAILHAEQHRVRHGVVPA